MPSIDFSGTKADFRVNYREVFDAANGVSNIYIDSVQIKSTVWSGVTYYACGKILVGGQLALEMDGTATYSVYVGQVGVWYTFSNTEISTPVAISNDGKSNKTTTIGIGAYGNYTYFNAWCISNRQGDAYASVQSQTINLYKLPTYILSISAGTGSTITVKRNGTTLANGATLYQGDSLVITFGATTGYNLGTHTVNGSTFTSGNTHIVNSAVSVVSTASVKSFTLTMSAGTGSGITVNRTSSPLKGAATGNLSNNATIYYNDVLKISFSVSTGYNLGTHTVNGSTFTSGNNQTVTSSINVVSTASLKTFTLSISAGTGSFITVKRGSQELSNGSTITYGDTLKISFSVATGYNLGTHTVNGTTFTSGGSYTVSSAVSVVSTASLKTFTLSISKDSHSTITVKRGGTTLNNGATLTYGDILNISYGANTGYELVIAQLNGGEIPATYTVIDNVVIVLYTEVLQTVHISNGTSFNQYIIYIGNGTSYDIYRAFIGNDVSWEPYC